MARILVIGGSLGGLLAANMLWRAGHEVKVLEKAVNSLDGRGAGIVTHRPLVAALARCGIAPDAPLGVAVEQRVVLARDGSIAEQACMAQVLTSWSRLYALLLAALPVGDYLQGASVRQASQNDQGVTVVCDDGLLSTPIWLWPATASTPWCATHWHPGFRLNTRVTWHGAAFAMKPCSQS